MKIILSSFLALFLMSPLILQAAARGIPMDDGPRSSEPSTASPSITPQEEPKIIPIQEVFEPVAPLDSSQYGKVAVIQWASLRPAPLGGSAESIQNYKLYLRNHLERRIRAAAANGAELIITPEFALTGYPDIPELPDEEDNFRNPSDLAPFAEIIPGQSTDYFSQLARELNIYLHIGFAEQDKKSKVFYNAVVALNPQGEIVAHYRKMNLFELEKKYLKPGRTPSIYDSPFGKIGLIICADVYSYAPLNEYKRQQVNVIALSTSWARYNTGMEYFIRAARSMKAYLLAANQSYYPDSGVINPDGSTQSHIRQTTDGIAYGYLPKK